MALTHEQQLAVNRRNAMLRAWKAYGLPFELTERQGQWVTSPFSASIWKLTLQCLTCGKLEGVSSRDQLVTDTKLVYWESSALADLAKRGCTHLLGIAVNPAPDEVMAIFELEILSGGFS